jgi:hypothetical protein
MILLAPFVKLLLALVTSNAGVLLSFTQVPSCMSEAALDTRGQGLISERLSPAVTS